MQANPHHSGGLRRDPGLRRSQRSTARRGGLFVTTDSQGASHALVYTDKLPLEWSVVTGVPDAAEQAGTARHNLDVLRAILALERYPRAEPDDGRVGSDIERIERKLDQTIDLLGYLSAQLVRRPDAVSIELSPHTLTFTADPAPPNSGHIEVRLFLSYLYPGALHLRGQARAAENLSRDGLGPVCLDWHLQSEAVEDALEQFLFTRHRRQIATHRVTAPTEG
jgi:hypothetical protein